MNHHVRAGMVALAAAMLAGTCGGALAQEADGYDAMLSWLADTHIDDRAFSGASGALAVNMAAGDLNQQANLRSVAAGEYAAASAWAQQHHDGDYAQPPAQATARIGGGAFSGASGIASINQASGVGNTELNVVTAALAQRGIREANDDFLSSPAFASAGPQYAKGPGAAETDTREVDVEASALQGFSGVLQLNQVAGSGNATGNQLLIQVQTVP